MNKFFVDGGATEAIILSGLGAGTTVLGIVVGALWGGAILGAIRGAIDTALTNEFPKDPIAFVMPQFTGIEIVCRLSPVKFHRRLYNFPQPPLPNTGISTRRIPIASTDNEIRERYQCQALGGTYNLDLVVDLA